MVVCGILGLTYRRDDQIFQYRSRSSKQSDSVVKETDSCMGNGSCFVVTPVLSEPAVEIANDEKINIIHLRIVL